jgi:hypothetical protein
MLISFTVTGLLSSDGTEPNHKGGVFSCLRKNFHTLKQQTYNTTLRIHLHLEIFLSVHDLKFENEPKMTPSNPTTEENDPLLESPKPQKWYTTYYKSNKGALLILCAELFGSSMDAMARFLQQGGDRRSMHPFQVRKFPFIIRSFSKDV